MATFPIFFPIFDIILKRFFVYILFILGVAASGRAIRLKQIRFAHTRLLSLTRFTPLRYNNERLKAER
nr:MAG TPA: hypothetical protein [Microviridae sp.]